MSTSVSKSATFVGLPPPWPQDLHEAIHLRPKQKLIVLDDDPTGTQTVHDVPVLTVWDVDTLRAEFDRQGDCFFILTNSRSLTAQGAEALNSEIAQNLYAAAASRPFTLVSRSDSTLRGHFPLETDVLSEELGPFDATLIIPYFEAGGRYTIGDIHYVAEGDTLVPSAETPFAKDKVFGYTHSNLREWVEEKTAGRVQTSDVASISLDLIRIGGPQEVKKHLIGLTHGSVCIVNAASLADMDVVALALLEAEQTGRRFLIRSAAQIVSARLGLKPRSLLTAQDLDATDYCGGVILVGSYVPKTTEQLTHLLAHTDVDRVELSVADLLDETQRPVVLDRALQSIHMAIQAGRNIVVFTSRDLITGQDAAANLDIGQQVSAALVELVQRLQVRPRFLIAKGGITSSDIATQGLAMRRGIVVGQLLPGVPVWRLGEETRFPGMGYVVFPGNVGGKEALTEALKRLTDL